VKKWLVEDEVKGDDLQWVSFPGEVKLYLLSDGTRPEGTNSKVLGFIADPPAIRAPGCSCLLIRRVGVRITANGEVVGRI